MISSDIPPTNLFLVEILEVTFHSGLWAEPCIISLTSQKHLCLVTLKYDRPLFYCVFVMLSHVHIIDVISFSYGMYDM